MHHLCDTDVGVLDYARNGCASTLTGMGQSCNSDVDCAAQCAIQRKQ